MVLIRIYRVQFVYTRIIEFFSQQLRRTEAHEFNHRTCKQFQCTFTVRVFRSNIRWTNTKCDRTALMGKVKPAEGPAGFIQWYIHHYSPWSNCCCNETSSKLLKPY